MKMDWRHFTGAGVVLAALIALLWWMNLGRSPAHLTAPAAAGSNPIAETPPDHPKENL